jgi:uncharacterized damage-inducible protein DinB
MAESLASESTLRELLRGQRAHADPIACVEGLTPELAGRRVNGFPHSIWQLVFHMNYWMDYELKRIRGERPAYPAQADGSWPPAPATANEAEWQQASMEFRTLIEKLSALAGSHDLDRKVESMHASQEPRDYSVRDVLWQTMAHNSYHIGQITMLRRMLDAWPPQGGGDTW